MRFFSVNALATALLFVNASGAFAKDHGAPGPIAGAGIAYLAIAGGYYAVRRWRNRKAGE